MLADGTDAGLQNALTTWGEKLAGFSDRPELIRKALQCLPQHPPTLPEFLALCRQQSVTLQDTLPPPTPDAERRQRNIESAAAVKVVALCVSPVIVSNLLSVNRLKAPFTGAKKESAD